MRGITLGASEGEQSLGELSQLPAAWHDLNFVYISIIYGNG